MSARREAPLLQALRGEAAARRPIWIMRQAGRYLPEYRATRARAGSFLALMRTPDLATEVTLQPLARFDLDAAILFSDILTIPDALGFGLAFVDGEGPRLARRIESAADVAALKPVDGDALGYVYQAVRQIRAALPSHLPLIGFAGAPYTLATYLLDGGAGEQERIKHFLAADPAAGGRLLQQLADAVHDHLLAQADAGADVLMLFDSWAGMLPPSLFRRFNLPLLAGLMARLERARPDVPKILFCRGAGWALPELGTLAVQGLGVDWSTCLRTVRAQVPASRALQGNLDPAALKLPEQALRQEVRAVIEAYGPAPGHIYNLGHGITPDVPPEAVSWMVDEIRQADR